MLRAFTGLFDSQTPLFQAFLLLSLLTYSCTGDVTTQRQRAFYLSQLESVNNFSQAVGPIIGGILSAYSLNHALYVFHGIVTHRFAGCCFYITAVFASFFLPETLEILLERRRMLANLKTLNLPKEEFEERKKRLLYQLNVQSGGSFTDSFLDKTVAAQNTSSDKKSKKLKLNYVMVSVSTLQ